MNKIKELKKEITDKYFVLKTKQSMYTNKHTYKVYEYLVNIDENDIYSIFSIKLSSNVNDAKKFKTLKEAKNFIYDNELTSYLTVII